MRRHGDFIPGDLVEKIIREIKEVYVYSVPAESDIPGESVLVPAVSPFSGRKIDPVKKFKHWWEKLPKNFVPTCIPIFDEISKTPSEKPNHHLLKITFNPHAENAFRGDKFK